MQCLIIYLIFADPGCWAYFFLNRHHNNLYHRSSDLYHTFLCASRWKHVMIVQARFLYLNYTLFELEPCWDDRNKGCRRTLIPRGCLKSCAWVPKYLPLRKLVHKSVSPIVLCRYSLTSSWGLLELYFECFGCIAECENQHPLPRRDEPSLHHPIEGSVHQLRKKLCWMPPGQMTASSETRQPC